MIPGEHLQDPPGPRQGNKGQREMLFLLINLQQIGLFNQDLGAKSAQMNKLILVMVLEGEKC